MTPNNPLACHSGESPLLPGMVFECVLKVLHDQAVWVESQPADSTIALAPKMASYIYADACTIPCGSGFSRDGLRAIAAKAAPTFSSRGFSGSDKAFRTVVGESRNPARKNTPRSGQIHGVVPLARRILDPLDLAFTRKGQAVVVKPLKRQQPRFAGMAQFCLLGNPG